VGRPASTQTEFRLGLCAYLTKIFWATSVTTVSNIPFKFCSSSGENCLYFISGKKLVFILFLNLFNI